MSRILELLAQIDKANAEHSPSRRADYADALVDELRGIFTDDRLAEIAQAERDGRLVVLPCKVGDTVYVLPNYTAYWDDIEETKITGAAQFMYGGKASNQVVTSLCLCFIWERDFGVRLFLTRAEAESALEQRKGANK